jgi:predicted signal transduction protein with EAL and GGDEF domain
MLSESLVLILTQIFAAASLALMVVQLLASRKSRRRADELLSQLEVGRREYRLMQYRATNNKHLMEISSIFIGSTQSGLDEAVHSALQLIGGFYEVERASILLLDEDEGTFSCINEWCKSGVSKHVEELQDLSIKDYPWLCDKTKSRIPVLINSVNDVPRSSKALRMQMHEAGTKSMMVVPLINRDHVLGCLRIESTLSERQWSSSEHEGLNLVAEILASELSHLQAEQNIRDNQRNFQNMIAYAPVAMFVFNCKGIVQYAEGRALARAGFISSHLLGEKADTAFEGNQNFIESLTRALGGVDFHAALKLGNRDFDGHFTPVIDSNSKVTSVVVTAIDISDRAQFEERLAKEKLYDNVTGLPNRNLLIEKIINFQERFQRGITEKGYLFVLAVNRTAPLHSALGSAAMHDMVRQIGDRLTGYFASDKHIAHIGEYDFGVLSEDIDNDDDALEMARELQLEFTAPLFLEERQLNITCSIGIARSDMRQENAEDWLREAQTACVAASKDGGGTERMFHLALASEALSAWQISEQLKQAISENTIEAWLQPIVNMETRKPIGFEALARWEISPGNFIPPNQFIPIAEEYGLIEELGNIMLRKSCRLLSECHKMSVDFKDLYVSVNVASSQLEKSSFLPSVKRLIENYHIQPHLLQLEITEREAVNPNQEVVPLLHKAHEMGFKIALDDFGTGYNSLSYLNNLPATSLKIDRSFVVGMDRSSTGVKVITSIIELARTIDLSTITEGVETESQRQQLLAMGCIYAQGYLFSRPLSPDQVAGYLSDHNPSIN